MRIVLDTNVLLAGVFTRGVCERVLDLCWTRSPSVTVIASEYLLAEFSSNATAKFGAPPSLVAEAIQQFRQRMEIVEPVEIGGAPCRDADDVPILGTALAGQAELLVTGDGDLLALGMFQGVTVVSPRQFFDRVMSPD